MSNWAVDLPDAFHILFLGVELWQWIALAVFAAVSTLLALVISLVAKRHLPPREGAVVDLRRGSRKAISVVFGVLAFKALLPLVSLTGPPAAFAGDVLRATLTVTITWLLANLWVVVVDNLTHRADDVRAERLFLPIMGKFVRTAILAIGALVAVSQFISTERIGAIIAGLGIGGLVVALAAKDSVENFFGSLTILFDMPFRIGDWVKIGAVEGVVEEINLRSTRVRTFEDSLVTLPNSNLIKASVENFGLRRVRRQRLIFRLLLDNDPDEIDAMMAEVRAYLDTLEAADAPRNLVALNDVGNDSIGLLVQAFVEVETLAAELELREAIIAAVMRSARAHGVVFLGPLRPVVPAG